MDFKKFIRMLGPGLLYAGAAVGVSHLVQSTRAGANFGFELIWVLIFVNIIKYPFFEFGPRYANATGKSLIDGYQTLGKWALVVITVLTIATMFAIQAAVTIVTAGLVANIFRLNLDVVYISAIILAVIMFVLMIGKYKALDNLIKLIIVLLAISTLLAVVFGFSHDYHPENFTSSVFQWDNKLHILFLIAFIGWMPAPIDISIWQSLWTVAKTEQLGYKPKLKQSLLDFKIGFIGTIFLAIGFVILGALVMFGSGEELSPKGDVFSGQLISMYTSSLGQWAYWLIAIAALTTMFSTTLTVFDAYPRVLSPITKIYALKNNSPKTDNYIYWIWAVILFIGTLLLLGISGKSMGFMVDLATTISFVTAPFFAIMNYLVVTNKQMPELGRPKLGLRIYSLVGIVFLSAFSLFYILWMMKVIVF
jgi:Mn2+/Fe2+ NRAMP family transporter